MPLLQGKLVKGLFRDLVKEILKEKGENTKDASKLVRILPNRLEELVVSNLSNLPIERDVQASAQRKPRKQMLDLGSWQSRTASSLLSLSNPHSWSRSPGAGTAPLPM